MLHSRSRVRALALFTALTLLLALAATAGAAAPAPAADVAPAADTSGPVCVPDLVGQFNGLKHHAEALGFHLNGSPDPNLGKHFQGIQRLPGAGTPYLYLSRNGNPTLGDPIGTEPGRLLVVEMGSRDTSGDRLRSNKLARGKESEETAPPAEDRVVTTITFDGSNGWPDYRHGGGMQTFGDILAVPLENKGPNATKEGMILLVDLADPANPTKLAEITFDHTAGAVALARRASNDRILLVVEGPQSNEKLLVYQSNTDDLRADDLSFELIDEWHKGELAGGSWPTGTTAHQSINILEDCDGSLFLLGTRGSSALPEGGTDEAYVYRFAIDAFDQTTISQVARKEFFCVAAYSRNCNFVAAGAFHVTPRGELILYGSEHENEGAGNPASVRMAEFRSRDGHWLGSSAWSPAADAGEGYQGDEGGTIALDRALGTMPEANAWGELYDDNTFNDRSVVIDFQDYYLEDWDDFDELDDAPYDTSDGFGDLTSSVRWAAPEGCALVLYEDHDFGGRRVELPGNGQVQEIANLDAKPWEFGDETSSARFEGACGAVGMTAGWDLDGDGAYETPGLDATLDASAIDGGTTVNADLRVCGPFLGRCATDRASVLVRNVAPSVTAELDTAEIDETGSVTVSVTIDDPAPADTFSVAVDWFDGMPEYLSLPAGTTTFTRTHVYGDDDPAGTPADLYGVQVTVTDDDGGTDSAGQGLLVTNVAPVLASVTSSGPVTSGSSATVTASASDIAGDRDPLLYAFDCDNDGVYEVGPQLAASTSCDFGIREGAFRVNALVADDDTGTATGSVVVDVPTFLCVNPNSGLTRYVDTPGCQPKEQALTLPADGPLAFCVKTKDGSLRARTGSGCRANETALTLPSADGITACVSSASRQLRAVASVADCRGSEFARVLGVRQP